MANAYFIVVTEKEFRVKDPEAFKRELERLGVYSIRDRGLKGGLTYDVEEDGRFWLGGYDATLSVWDPETDGEIDIGDVIQKHIAPGEVAVLIMIGHEKLRWADGTVLVVSEKGMRYKTLAQVADELAEEFQ